MRDAKMNPDAKLEGFARIVARRVSPVLPDGFVAWDERGSIMIRSTNDPIGQESHLSALVTPDPDCQSLRIGVLNVLNTLQDYISEALTIPWPSTDHEMALPDVVCAEGTLRFWYGDGTRPVLAFQPIDISYLIE